jgi:hypothetical protein
LDLPGFLFTPIHRVITKQQSDCVTVIGQMIGELRTKLARGKVGQTPHLIERLVSWSRGYDTVHGLHASLGMRVLSMLAPNEKLRAHLCQIMARSVS